MDSIDIILIKGSKTTGKLNFGANFMWFWNSRHFLTFNISECCRSMDNGWLFYHSHGHPYPYYDNFKDLHIQICFTDFHFRILSICHKNQFQARKKGSVKYCSFLHILDVLGCSRKCPWDIRLTFVFNLCPVQRKCDLSYLVTLFSRLWHVWSLQNNFCKFVQVWIIIFWSWCCETKLKKYSRD